MKVIDLNRKNIYLKMMCAKIMSVSTASLEKAASLIKSGELVAFPTETVYGLGADATKGLAVAKIFEAKGRPNFNPLITHVRSLEEAEQYGEFSKAAKMIAHQFWPGPLSIIVPLKRDCGISELVTAGLDTIALRVPSHKTAQAFLSKCECPIAAPSANRSGSLSPTSALHVNHSLGDKIEIVLADGASEIGLESTVLDMSGDKPFLLRSGAITADDVSEILGKDIELHDENNDAPKSPGQLLKHYAPDTPIRLNAVDVKSGEALLGFGSIKFMGVEGGGFARDLPDGFCINLSEEGDFTEAASNLFAMLYKLDEVGAKGIAVMEIPDIGLGVAINDRLRRAERR